MAKLLNRFKLPSIPIFWTHGKTRIEWRPAQATFYQWAEAVWAFCDGNRINPRPTEDQLDELACRQIPTGYCNGTARHIVAHPLQTVTRPGGCCGNRH